MKKLTFLMPRCFLFLGIFLFFAGLILGIFRFRYGFKPDALDMKMFAFYSSYLETRYLEIVRNNMSEELVGFFLITGLFFIAFSREKNENEHINILRQKAFYISAYFNFMFLLFSLFFTYGLAFIYMLMLNMGTALLSYIISFRIFVLTNRSQLQNM